MFILYSVICKLKFWQAISDTIASLDGEIVFSKIQDNVDFANIIEDVKEFSISHLIVDVTTIRDVDEKEFIETIKNYHIKNDKVRIVIFAPDYKPGNVLLHKLVSMGIYDIIAPDMESLHYLGSILENTIQTPLSHETYRNAAKWTLLEDPDDDRAREPINKNKKEIIVKEIEVIRKVYETPSDYKKKVGFIGHHMAGVTSLICWLGTYFNSQKVSTAILDLTHNRDLYEIYPFNQEGIEGKTNVNSLGNLIEGIVTPYVIKKNLHLFTSSKDTQLNLERIEDYVQMIQMLEAEYDVILVDMDYETPISIIYLLNNIFLLQTLDVKKLKFNTEYQLKLLSYINMKKVKYVVNQVINCDIKSDVISECLKVHTNLKDLRKTVIINDGIDFYEIPFCLEAHKQGLLSEYNIKKLNPKTMDAIGKIANNIYPLNKSTIEKGLFRKFIKR